VLLGFRNREHAGGLELFCGSGGDLCPEVRLASEDGHRGHRGYVTDLLATILAGDDAASAVVYSCGPPAMLDAVAQLCESRNVPCELAMESPMACGYGACFGCAIPKPDGGYHRLCVDGPVMRPTAGGVVDSELGTDPSAAGPVAAASPTVLGGGATSAPPGATAATPAAEAGSGAVDFCGLKLRNPVINASGTYDAIAARKVFGDELLDEFPFSAFVSKTITPEPRAGNAPQRIWETPAGMVNSIGLPNKGLEGFLAEDLPRLADLPVPLIVSVMATNREDFSRLVGVVAARDEVAAIELNVSCPNVHSGLIVGEQPAETEALLEALRPLSPKPLIVKLTPNVADPAAVAVAAEQGGADAVSLINTLKASAIDPASGAPALAAGHGGLSGPAVRPVALQQLRAVVAATGIPAIGMGGISHGADAREFFAAGASLVAVGTENFKDPQAGSRVAAELRQPATAGAAAASVLNLK
jgi:dihydroorotate dehydrogenase (NAD+) catalytic subunit